MDAPSCPLYWLRGFLRPVNIINTHLYTGDNIDVTATDWAENDGVDLRLPRPARRLTSGRLIPSNVDIHIKIFYIYVCS